MQTAVAIATVCVAAIAGALPAHARTAYLCPGNGTRSQELRIYDINPANRGPFHARFRNHAARLMKKHGFTITDAWEGYNGDKLQLVYILDWPDQATKDAKWKEFRADPEWIKVKDASVAEHGDLMLAPSHGQPMTRLTYSPACKRRASH